jgi:hypothetical protein
VLATLPMAPSQSDRRPYATPSPDLGGTPEIGADIGPTWPDAIDSRPVRLSERTA